MQTRFYTVRYSFPLKWKVFMLAMATFSLVFFVSSTFRRSLIQLIPSQKVIVELSSSKIDGVSSPLHFLFNDEKLHALTKNNIIEFPSCETVFKSSELRGALQGKKSSALSCGLWHENKLYIGDWKGRLYWKNLEQWHSLELGAAKINDIAYFDGLFYVSTLNGLCEVDLTKKNSARVKLLGNKEVQNFVEHDGALYTSTENKIYIKKLGEVWRLAFTTSSKINQLIVQDSKLIMATQSGLFNQDKLLGLEGMNVTKIRGAFATDGVSLFHQHLGKWYSSVVSTEKDRIQDLIQEKDELLLLIYGKGLVKVSWRNLYSLESAP
jgi:hypothetical protein